MDHVLHGLPPKTLGKSKMGGPPLRSQQGGRFLFSQTEHITKSSHHLHGSAQTGHSPNIQPLRVGSPTPHREATEPHQIDPRDPGRSSEDMATARAAAQDKREPQRRRHACCTRFLSRNLSVLSWASRLRNGRVLVDRPPLAVSSGYVRSFR